MQTSANKALIGMTDITIATKPCPQTKKNTRARSSVSFSPAMEAKESLYNGRLSDYSEDFEEEEESEVRAAARPPAARQKTPVTDHDPDLFRRSTKSHSVARKHTGSKSKG